MPLDILAMAAASLGQSYQGICLWVMLTMLRLHHLRPRHQFLKSSPSSVLRSSFSSSASSTSIPRASSSVQFL
ncbi:hypothetical protein QYF36_021968 [Acer negundo]|nr:hypothetical protein QYF36_021968 [Acer negundo]